MKIENRQQFLVMLTIAAAALFVGVNFVAQPLGNWWSARQKQVKQLRIKVSDGQKLIKREQIIRDSWSTMQANALPASTSAAESQLLKSMDEWSQQRGAQVTSLMPQWKNASTNYLTLACRVETAGDIGALSKFLYDLEKGPLALRLDSVELGARDKEGYQMTMSVEINGLALLTQTKK